MTPTQSLLNLVAYPSPGQNVRRIDTQIYSKVAIATATTSYNFFTNTQADIFTSNKTLPLPGNEIFAAYNLGLYLDKPVNTTALYTALLDLLQKSYLEIKINNKVVQKLVGLEIVNYLAPSTIGNTTPVDNGRVSMLGRTKTLIIPDIFNQTASVSLKLYTTSTFTTAFNGANFYLYLNGIQSNLLDTGFVNMVKDSAFQDVAYTIWESQAISSANQTDFNLFANANQSENLFSKVLPLSQAERFEVQNIEIFFPGNVATTETLELILNNRIQNYFKIIVDNVVFYEANLRDIITAMSAYSTTFTDGTTTTDIVNIDEFHNKTYGKTLSIPLILPANGQVRCTLTQPGSSLNVNQYFTAMLKGRMKWSVN